MERPATFIRNPIDSLRGRGKCRRITPTQKRQTAPAASNGSPKKLLIVISEPTCREEDASQRHEGTHEGGTQVGGTQAEGTVSPTH